MVGGVGQYGKCTISGRVGDSRVAFSAQRVWARLRSCVCYKHTRVDRPVKIAEAFASQERSLFPRSGI